jgi:hypothetical protein
LKLGELRRVAGVSQWTIATRCSLQDSHLMFLQNCNSIFPLNTFAQARICRQARLGYYNKKNVTRKQTASELLFFIIKKNGRWHPTILFSIVCVILLRQRIALWESGRKRNKLIRILVTIHVVFGCCGWTWSPEEASFSSMYSTLQFSLFFFLPRVNCLLQKKIGSILPLST